MSAEAVSYRYPRMVEPVAPPTDLELRQGEAVALTGANGSGKSTLAMMMAGLRAPATGTVRAAASAKALHRWPARKLAGTVGTVFQEPEHQFLTGTVRDEVALGPRLRGTVDEPAVDALLDRLRLLRLAAANPFTLSGGEKRRLSVATALATAPAALVLDEPTFGQDAATWTELLTLLGDLRDQGCAVLAVTHDEAFAAALADRHVAMPC